VTLKDLLDFFYYSLVTNKGAAILQEPSSTDALTVRRARTSRALLAIRNQGVADVLPYISACLSFSALSLPPFLTAASVVACFGEAYL
jgi:hypothetical protein